MFRAVDSSIELLELHVSLGDKKFQVVSFVSGLQYATKINEQNNNKDSLCHIL